MDEGEKDKSAMEGKVGATAKLPDNTPPSTSESITPGKEKSAAAAMKGESTPGKETISAEIKDPSPTGGKAQFCSAKSGKVEANINPSMEGDSLGKEDSLKLGNGKDKGDILVHEAKQAVETYTTKELEAQGANEKKGSKVVEKTSDSSSLETEQIVEQGDKSDDDGVGGAFGRLGKGAQKKRRKKKSRKVKPIRISIPSHVPKPKGPELAKTSRENQYTKHDVGFDDVEEEEDPLEFYSSTHEEQNPDYLGFHSARLRHRLEVEVAKLQKDKDEDMNKIEAYLSARWDERNGKSQSHIEQVRTEMKEKQMRQRAQLSEKHRRQLETDDRKIADGEKWLTEKQQAEFQQQQMNFSNNMMEWNAVAAQLQTRHAYQRRQFEEKKLGLKKRSEQELKAQNQILECHHKKRQLEADAQIKDMEQKYHKQQENLKAKLTRLHEERFDKMKNDIEAECTLTHDGASETPNATQGSADMFQMPNLKGTGNTSEPHDASQTAKGSVHEGSVSHDAVMRQKRRKNLMNSVTIQLAIEIHNEGIIAMTRSTPHEGEKRSTESEDAKLASDKSTGRSSTFVPWGVKARALLYSIVVGEIPSDPFFDQICRRGALGGGLVKCMITDTRTSEDTATQDRAATFAQVRIAKRRSRLEEIEHRYNNACNLLQNLQAEATVLMEKEGKLAAAHKEAALGFERAKQTLDKFKAQAQHFFRQDGTPSPRVNPDSQQKLVIAMKKYKHSYDSTKQKEITLREALELARNGLKHKQTEGQRLQHEAMTLEGNLKEARQSLANVDEAYSLETIIEDVTATLNKMAEKRRSQVNRNKSNSSNSSRSEAWEKAMSLMPEEKKKSFHQKMLRRRITTMLRPSHASMVAEVKRMARTKSSTSNDKDCFDIKGNDDEICPELRAEQLLLLALHPESPKDPLPPVPDQSLPGQSWAEPGWQLIIEDPDFGNFKSASSILPIVNEGHLSQQFLSSCCSSGRQAASLIAPRHLRMLEAPMSSTCQASAPAESNPSGEKKPSPNASDVFDSDPLYVTEDKLRLGYQFDLSPSTVEQSLEQSNERPNEDPKVKPAICLARSADTSKTNTKKRRPSKKADVKSTGKAPAKRRKSQTKATKKQSAKASQPDINPQNVPQNQLVPPLFPNNSMPNQNLPMRNQQQNN
ncbi:hypothetical protein ACHAWF_013723 [Thalassiosira exigua]